MGLPEELERLWRKLEEPPVVSYLCRFAVMTGMCFGELAARRWEDVNLLWGEIVARTVRRFLGTPLGRVVCGYG